MENVFTPDELYHQLLTQVKGISYIEYRGDDFIRKDLVFLLMKQYAELHVEEALYRATIKIKSDALEEYGTDVPDCWNLESITYAYPNNLIK